MPGAFVPYIYYKGPGVGFGLSWPLVQREGAQNLAPGLTGSLIIS